MQFHFGVDNEGAIHGGTGTGLTNTCAYSVGHREFGEWLVDGFLPLLDKLAAYEDTGLMPDEINAIAKSQIATAKHNVELQEEAARFKADLQRYKQLEADGRLVELPCLVNGRSVLTRHPRTGRLITVRCDTRTEAETMIAKCPACRAEKEVAE